MTVFTPRPGRPALRGAALAAALLLGGPLASVNHAHAALACRADPVLWINVAGTNNAYKVQVTASVGTASSDVQGIVYTVHAPVGTVLTSVGYTGGAFAHKESVQFVADSAAGTFGVTTTVTTSTHAHAVTATETVSHPGFNSGTPTTQASGTDGQNIATSVYQS